ncbi:MAG: cytochrome c biogenesis protein [Acidobacteriota bacterium]
MRLFLHILLAVVSVLLVGVLLAVFGDTVVFPIPSYVPTETTMGIVQRIFYFHVPSAMTSFLAFFVAFVASVGYLTTRRLFWDNLARASVETGILFCTVVLVTGPLWARPIWGAWWPWEPRLTTTLIMWLIYISYLLLQTYTDNRLQKARFCAVLGIVAFLNVPLVYYSVRWWRGIHPVVFGRGGGGIAPRMSHAFLASLLTFFLLFLLLVIYRTRIGILEDEVEGLQESAGGWRDAPL